MLYSHKNVFIIIKEVLKKVFRLWYYVYSQKSKICFSVMLIMGQNYQIIISVMVKDIKSLYVMSKMRPRAIMLQPFPPLMWRSTIKWENKLNSLSGVKCLWLHKCAGPLKAGDVWKWLAIKSRIHFKIFDLQGLEAKLHHSWRTWQQPQRAFPPPLPSWIKVSPILLKVSSSCLLTSSHYTSVII